MKPRLDKLRSAGDSKMATTKKIELGPAIFAAQHSPSMHGTRGDVPMIAERKPTVFTKKNTLKTIDTALERWRESTGKRTETSSWKA